MRRSRGVLLIAHRGASAVAPEGTRAAIQGAVRAGAQMIELDVQLMRDGRLVIFHDDRLERTTNGRGLVASQRYAALSRLDAGRWFDPRFSGERILLVSEVFRLVPRRVGVNLELKRTKHRQKLVTGIRRLLARSRVGSRLLLLSSFDPNLIQPFLRTRLPRALICRRDPDRVLHQAIQLGCVAWHPFHELVTPRRLTRAHAAGVRVHAWTVDDARRARQLIRWGVDGLFTNDPARLGRLLRRRGR